MQDEIFFEKNSLNHENEFVPDVFVKNKYFHLIIGAQNKGISREHLSCIVAQKNRSIRLSIEL